MRLLPLLLPFTDATVGGLAVPLTARAACHTTVLTPHVVDPAMQATDQVPPDLWPIATVELRRPRAAEGCGSTENDCEGYAVVMLPLVASDNATGIDKIGFRITLAEGTLPAGLALPAEAVDFPPDGNYFFEFAWYSPADASTASFTLQVIAIDLAGNESAPQLVEVREPIPPSPNPTTYNDGNCQISNTHPAPRGIVFMTFLVAMAVSRRRCSRTRR